MASSYIVGLSWGVSFTAARTGARMPFPKTRAKCFVALGWYFACVGKSLSSYSRRMSSPALYTSDFLVCTRAFAWQLATSWELAPCAARALARFFQALASGGKNS